jgi:hypothetical protein
VLRRPPAPGMSTSIPAALGQLPGERAAGTADPLTEVRVEIEEEQTWVQTAGTRENSRGTSRDGPRDGPRESVAASAGWSS